MRRRLALGDGVQLAGVEVERLSEAEIVETEA